jgi:hypothetical protein
LRPRNLHTDIGFNLSGLTELRRFSWMIFQGVGRIGDSPYLKEGGCQVRKLGILRTMDINVSLFHPAQHRHR